MQDIKATLELPTETNVIIGSERQVPGKTSFEFANVFKTEIRTNMNNLACVSRIDDSTRGIVICDLMKQDILRTINTILDKMTKTELMYLTLSLVHYGVMYKAEGATMCKTK